MTALNFSWLSTVSVVDVLCSWHVLLAQSVVVQARLEVLVVIQVEEGSVQVHDLFWSVEVGNSVQIWLDVMTDDPLGQWERQTRVKWGQGDSGSLVSHCGYDSVSSWKVSQVFGLVCGHNSSQNRCKSKCTEQSGTGCWNIGDPGKLIKSGNYLLFGEQTWVGVDVLL